MKKNWLIRTKEHELIGPVSKEKVVTLLKEGKLLDEDEICKGNSFWFYVKEKTLIKELLDLEVVVKNEADSVAEIEEFVLETNSGKSTSLEKDQKSTTEESSTVNAENESVSQGTIEEEVVENTEVSQEVIGDKFNLPENKKITEIDEVKKQIHSEVEKEVKKEQIINETKKNLIYPIILLLLFSSLLYLFYYVKFLGGKIPFLSNANATTVEKEFTTQKKKI